MAQTNKMLKGHTLYESCNMLFSLVDFLAIIAKCFLWTEEFSSMDIL